jgi:hypothetical protein
MATAETLRTLHARHAEKLALASWEDPSGNGPFHLIENTELRNIYGKLIGRIAHSHWWPAFRLPHEFATPLGAPTFAPNSWTVDPLKIAAILRVADFAHLDDRRAPRFLRVLRNPSDVSLPHWLFQGNLQKPQVKEDRLVFTAGSPLSIKDAAAWWLCFDTLTAVDDELRATDSMLADEGRPRLAARGVAGVESPMRLMAWIPTDGWTPVDTQVRVTRVTRLVRNLGGAALYGSDQTVPLRELIQNATDAIRARRLLDDKPDWGCIDVRHGRDPEGEWIEVEDNGVGMSEHVLARSLLDFGNSFWHSGALVKDFPGLASKGFSPTGIFGIGFFAVFVWGNHVRVTSRRFEDARKDTRVLEFNEGLGSRAVLRGAHEAEYMRDGGSRIRVWLKVPSNGRGGLLHPKFARSSGSLKQICAWLAPALDVNLFVQAMEGVRSKVVSNADWKDMDGIELLRRLYVLDGEVENPSATTVNLVANNLRHLHDDHGAVLGRAAVFPYGFLGFDSQYLYAGGQGLLSVGGLRSESIGQIAGIISATALTADRNKATPLVSVQELRRWASEQALLVRSATADEAELHSCAAVVWSAGGAVADLPIGLGCHGWLTSESIANWKEIPDELWIADIHELVDALRETSGLTLNTNVIAADTGFPGLTDEWPVENDDVDDNLSWLKRSLMFLVLTRISKAWSVPQSNVLEDFSDGYWGSGRSLVEVGRADGRPIRKDAVRITKRMHISATVTS